MDYLRGSATASATGLFVICQHLTHQASPRNLAELQAALEPLRESRGSDGASAEPGSILTASLAVGKGIGVLDGDDTAGWVIEDGLRTGLRSVEVDPWQWFRGELLYRMNHHAMAAIGHGDAAPDLILGMAWFLQSDPLNPLREEFGRGAEAAVRSLALEAIATPEQWRAFLRWTIALGLASRLDAGSQKVVVPDASTAIADQFSNLPEAGPVSTWLAVLRDRLPVLGSATLLAQLPKRSSAWQELPPGLALGLLKLEVAGRIELPSADDASDVVTLGLASTSRQVGRVVVRGGAA